MNFCFWPLEDFEYHNLATHVQAAVTKGISLEQLTNITEAEVVSVLFNGVKIPMAGERARILRELGDVVTHKFKGSFQEIINQADKSAVKLLDILTSNFPNFQDHSIYKGSQIHFYKRSQILIGDIFGRFNGTGLG